MKGLSLTRGKTSNEIFKRFIPARDQWKKIIFHHTDRNNKREKISFYLYITYVIYIFLIIPIFTYLYRQVRNAKYI